jgi:hypothetical protein
MKAKTMRRVYLREAAIMLLLARLAVRFLRPAMLFAWAERPTRRVRRFAIGEAQWVAWALDHVGSRARMDGLCLPRALAAHAMLRRRGIASRLCLGVARSGNTFAAHAWIEIGEERIIGGEEAAGFTRLAAFGGVKVS